MTDTALLWMGEPNGHHGIVVWSLGKGTGRGVWSVVGGWVVVAGVCGAEYMGYRWVDRWIEGATGGNDGSGADDGGDNGGVEAVERGEKKQEVDFGKGGDEKVGFRET